MSQVVDLLEPFESLQKRLNSAPDPNPERALSICREAGPEPLGIGSGRIALPVSSQIIVKVAWRDSGALDNQIEARLWETASDELKRILCPVLEIRESHILLQRRCLPMVGSAIDANSQAMVAELAKHGISDGIVNLGLLEDGRTVCYDYALIRPSLFGELFKGSFVK